MGDRRTIPLPPARNLGTGLFAAALVLWWFANWTIWVLLPLIGGLILVRLAMPLFPPAWRGWAGPALALVLVLFLMTETTVTASLVAFGVVVLLIAFGLRMASPTWARWVALGVAVAMIGGGGIAEFVSWANNRSLATQADRDRRDLEIATTRPSSSIGALHLLVDAIVGNDPARGCWLFSPSGAADFASVVGGADCPAAVHTLHGQLTGPPAAYFDVRVPYDDATPTDDSGVARVSACNMFTRVAGDEVPVPGLGLGQLRLEKDPRFPSGGYLITGYTRCGVLPPGVTPIKPTPPPVLPSYPPGYAATLAKAVASTDTDMCGQFLTDQAQGQLAVALGVADCPTAIRTLHSKVADADLYGEPQDATATAIAPDGSITVDACHLTWSRWGDKPGTPPPGPQLGYLVLTSPDRVGYLINGYRAC
jgi:hypothetical protein